MQTKSIDFVVPADWSELTDQQLRFVFRLLADDYTTDEVKLLCLLKWSGTKVVGQQSDGCYLLCKRNEERGTRDEASGASVLGALASSCLLTRPSYLYFEVSSMQLSEILTHLDWLGALPTYPVRVSHIWRHLCKHKALPADFSDVPFETYIIVDNLYQGYLKTQSDELLDQLAEVLYPSKLPFLSTLLSPLSAENRIAIFYWVASLKEFFSRRYPDFLQPTSSTSDGNLLGAGETSVEDAMNAQIRALTKGDITKEQEVLALDTHRALTELNAQAREYKELNSQIKSK